MNVHITVLGLDCLEISKYKASYLKFELGKKTLILIQFWELEVINLDFENEL